MSTELTKDRATEASSTVDIHTVDTVALDPSPASSDVGGRHSRGA